jgi:hypothetical protein
LPLADEEGRFRLQPATGILTRRRWAAVAAAPVWSLQWSPRVDSTREVLGQDYRTKRQTTEVERQFGTEARLDVAHEFRDLDLPAVDGVPADADGYEHRLTFAWQQRSDTLRLRLGAALAVSSNALKDPGDLGVGICVRLAIGARRPVAGAACR